MNSLILYTTYTYVYSPLNVILWAALAAAAAVQRRAETLPTLSEEEMDAKLAALNVSWPPASASPAQRLAKRIEPPPSCNILTSLVGDGDPHQNFWNVQVTQNFNCGNGGCDVTHEDSKTIGWTASVGFAQWITGGFTVMESYTTGNSYTCDGDINGEVCVWWNVAHTAYTVTNNWPGACGEINRSPYVIKSPNQNNVNGGGYCVRGAKYCRSINAGYWDDSGRAGGP